MKNKKLSNLNAALLLFLLLVVFTLIINLGGFQGNSQTNWISYLIIVGGITLLTIKFGKDMDNNVTFGNLFSYGFKTIAITIIFFIGFSILFYGIFPEYKAQLLEASRATAMKKATPENREQMEKGIEMFQRFFWVAMIAGILFSFAILGAIGSLLGAAIAKKEPRQLTD